MSDITIVVMGVVSIALLCIPSLMVYFGWSWRGTAADAQSKQYDAEKKLLQQQLDATNTLASYRLQVIQELQSRGVQITADVEKAAKNAHDREMQIQSNSSLTPNDVALQLLRSAGNTASGGGNTSGQTPKAA